MIAMEAWTCTEPHNTPRWTYLPERGIGKGVRVLGFIAYPYLDCVEEENLGLSDHSAAIIASGASIANARLA
jgi:hypothetical protein